MRQLTIASGLALALLLTGACRAKDDASNVAALIEELKSADREKSGRANLALIRVGEPAVPALLEMVASGDPRLRLLALSTIWGMGERAKTAAPFLADVLSDPDPEIRHGAAMALENMGAAAEAAVPALIEALGDADNRVRQTAVKALGNIGPAARTAVPTITLALRRGAWPEAEEALRKIKGQVEESPSPEPR